ncbi:uncharacterized protein [Eurosta solidaginis]|uniref:uncharacterized protein isoform X2 n=1 Tax=Eurosta solidaginis TaxID=178769 RepID=UPI0035317BF6
MRQLWKFVICITILTLCLVNGEETSAEYLNTTTTTPAPITTNTTTVDTSETLENATTPELLPTLAAKLVRQRRQHPYTIIRHVVRQAKHSPKSRRRYKYPKYKYGPPNYNTGAPISFYKPVKQYLPELADSPKYSPIDETLDLTNFNTADNYDFHPVSSSSASTSNGHHYEDETMDLDFYSHTNSGAKSYKKTPKLSQIEYSNKELPTYSYTSTKTTVSSKPLRSYGKSAKKHAPTYGSSGVDYSADDAYNFSPPENMYDMHPMGSYDAPSSSHANKFYDFTSVDTNSHSNLHIPAAKYGVPDVSIPLHYMPPPAKPTEYHPQQPSSADSYIVYEKKIPNAGYSSSKDSVQHDFAEPPAKTKVEITYSPPYEIPLPPAKHKPAPANNYQPPPPPADKYHPAPVEKYHPIPGNFAEPPPPPPPPSYKTPKTSAHPPPTYNVPAPPPYKHPTPPPTTNYHAPEAHVPPAPPIYYQETEHESSDPNSYGHTDLQESYESYETPETHAPTNFEEPELNAPVSFEQPESHAPHSFDQPDSHAPPSFQVPHPPIKEPADSFELPEPHAPPVYSAPSAPAEETHEPNYSITSSHSEYPQPDYITPSKDLPINSNYMPPAYNYPKSSYEVPIYDPIPFEASSAEEHETFPPHNFVNQHIDSGHTPAASSPIPTSNAPATHVPSNNEEENTAAAPPTRTTKLQRPFKKRKRLRNSTSTVSTKHILDTPELEEAYEANQQRKKKHQLALSNDADVNESNNVEAKPSNQPNYFLPTVSPDIVNDQNYISPAWNPVRIRAISTPTALPAALGGKAQTPPPASTVGIVRSKGRTQPSLRTSTTNRQQSSASFTPSHGLTRTRQTTPVHNEGGEQKVAVISVDKSHSYSYYDGTSAPPSTKNANVQRLRSSQKRQQQQQQLAHTPAVTIRQKAPTRDHTTSQRTTKSVFETTYFKSPRNDRYLEQTVQNLPKNHKLF